MESINEQVREKLEAMVPVLEKMRDQISGMLLFIESVKPDTETEIDCIGIVKKVVCDYFNVAWGELTIKTRKQEAVWARHIFMAAVRKLTKNTFASIGNLVNRDHTTAVYACKVIEDSKTTHSELFDHYEVIMERVNTILLKKKIDEQ